MIAAITLKLLDPFGTGKLVLFQVTYERVRSDLYAMAFEHQHLTNHRNLRTGTHMNYFLSLFWGSSV